MKHSTQSFSAFVIFAAVALATVFLAASSCSKAEEKPEQPEASSVLRRFQDGLLSVVEFRDSAGRVCVAVGIVGNGNAVALDCGRPLPPLEYEQLEQLFEKRPL